MTLRDFLKVLWRKLPIVIVILLVCLFAGHRVGVAQYTTSYTATATVTTNISTNVATGFASNVAAAATTSSVTVTAAASSSSASVTLTAKGDDPAACISAVNSAADSLQTQIKNGYAQSINSVRHAETTTTTASRSPRLYAAAGLLIGVALAIIALAIWDAATRRIHSWQTVRETKNVKYLGTAGGSDDRQRKLATTVRLASHGENGKPADTVYLVPVGGTPCAPAVAKQLEETAKKSLPEEFPAVVVDETVLKSAEAATDAEHVTRSVLVVEEERSTYPDLEDALRDFDVAGLTPAGFIYVGVSTARRIRKEANGQAATPAADAPTKKE